MSTGPFATGWRVSTGFLGQPQIVGVVGDNVWLAFKGHDNEEKKLASFDMATKNRVPLGPWVRSITGVSVIPISGEI